MEIQVTRNYPEDFMTRGVTWTLLQSISLCVQLLTSSFPAAPAIGVCISQFLRSNRACYFCEDWKERHTHGHSLLFCRSSSWCWRTVWLHPHTSPCPYRHLCSLCWVRSLRTLPAMHGAQTGCSWTGSRRSVFHQEVWCRRWVCCTWWGSLNLHGWRRVLWSGAVRHVVSIPG